jgi:hypothetical protein
MAPDTLQPRQADMIHSSTGASGWYYPKPLTVCIVSCSAIRFDAQCYLKRVIVRHTLADGEAAEPLVGAA